MAGHIDAIEAGWIYGWAFDRATKITESRSALPAAIKCSAPSPRPSA